MADRDKDLMHLFVRDLDDIELPSRDRWRPAPRKESSLMKTSRYFLYATAAVAVIVLALVASFALRDRDQVAATPGPTSPTTTTSAATAATASPGAPSPSPSTSSAGGRYVSALLGYSIETPPPWHRSSCMAVVTQQTTGSSGGDVFVPVSARDQTSTDIGAAYPELWLSVQANPQGLSPRQWAEQDRTISGRIEDVVYADRPAARNAVPGTALFTYFVANGDRMYKIEPHANRPPDAATQQAMGTMIESFRFLSAAEQAAARAALPAALPSRTPEQVADGVAAALAAKNLDALAGFLSPCVTTAGENAGGTTVSREKYLDDLRSAFAAGLVVTVQPRPLSGDRASGNLTVASTWQGPQGTKERKLTLRREDNDRWEWWGTIERFQ
jgi:hypothetical protein